MEKKNHTDISHTRRRRKCQCPQCGCGYVWIIYKKKMKEKHVDICQEEEKWSHAG
jgi:uncharacterized protein (DUF983 family)